jgi:thymidine kinase
VNRKPGKGTIELICGCMFSGKTHRLVERLQTARKTGLSPRAFKHASDVRYSEHEIASHDDLRFEAEPVAHARDMIALAGDAGLIAIDEAQFFEDDLVAVCQELASTGHIVVVAALDRDSWGEPFGPIPALQAVADKVIPTKAVCQCGAEAEFTQRLVAVEGQTMIGGPEAYTARCVRCFQPPPAELRR